MLIDVVDMILRKLFLIRFNWRRSCDHNPEHLFDLKTVCFNSKGSGLWSLEKNPGKFADFFVLTFLVHLDKFPLERLQIRPDSLMA
jgi:hypothetical protein